MTLFQDQPCLLLWKEQENSAEKYYFNVTCRLLLAHELSFDPALHNASVPVVSLDELSRMSSF